MRHQSLSNLCDWFTGGINPAHRLLRRRKLRTESLSENERVYRVGRIDSRDGWRMGGRREVGGRGGGSPVRALECPGTAMGELFREWREEMLDCYFSSWLRPCLRHTLQTQRHAHIRKSELVDTYSEIETHTLRNRVNIIHVIFSVKMVHVNMMMH